MNRQKWIDHKFETGIDVNWQLNVLCRVQDTAIRLEHHCKDLNNQQLSEIQNDAWSIKEHIGHLVDLEELWNKRFLDFKEKKTELLSADMSNQKTKQAAHNEQSLDALLYNFKTQRENTLRIFNALTDDIKNHQVMHPRIKKTMRPIDLLFFIAEHDNHHIASITRIKETF